MVARINDLLPADPHLELVRVGGGGVGERHKPRLASKLHMHDVRERLPSAIAGGGTANHLGGRDCHRVAHAGPQSVRVGHANRKGVSALGSGNQPRHLHGA